MASGEQVVETEKQLVLKEGSPENLEEQMVSLPQLFKKRRSSTPPKPQSMVHVDHGEKSARKTDMIKEDKAMSGALERAHELQKLLDPKFPSIVKYMLQSHVTRGFWMGLPKKFCNLYMPKEDATVTLIDENKVEHTAKFLYQKQGLSGGWRAFSVAHGLVEGDALIFHLVKATEFKVIIIKANNTDALGTITQPKKISSRKQIKSIKKKIEGKRPRTLTMADLRPSVENHENGTGEDASEVLEGIWFSGSTVKFEDIKDLKGFSVSVNGLTIDFELSKYTRSKYYELCRSQNGFLHDKLLEGMNYKLVAGIISETVNIADAIKGSKLSTSRNELASWDTCLGAFEQMGMNVGFLRAQLQQLVSTALESEQMGSPKMCSEDIDKLAHVDEDIRTLRTKIMELKNAYKRFKR